jgi:pSer/pThr/pTyr-binding forkhead associated (FHA) protein
MPVLHELPSTINAHFGSSADMTTNGYDPSLEFPGADSERDTTDENETITNIERYLFRLVITQSPVVPPRRNIAEVSVHNEVSIGRDIPSEPGAARLRLKEMAVSKYHAIIYWDLEREAWGLVDVGSVHGTFVKAHGNSASERLSSAKVASHPRYLCHLDSIQIGGTTMVCHLHDI